MQLGAGGRERYPHRRAPPTAAKPPGAAAKQCGSGTRHAQSASGAPGHLTLVLHGPGDPSVLLGPRAARRHSPSSGRAAHLRVQHLASPTAAPARTKLDCCCRPLPCPALCPAAQSSVPSFWAERCVPPGGQRPPAPAAARYCPPAPIAAGACFPSTLCLLPPAPQAHIHLLPGRLMPGVRHTRQR